MSSSILAILDCIEKTIAELTFGVRRGNVKTTGNELARLKAYSECLKFLLPVEFTRSIFVDFDRHLSFMERFFGERNFEWIMSNLDDIRLRDLPHIRESVYRLIESKKTLEKRIAPLSKNVFLVHGRDHKPTEELKTMLTGFGLKPIVLHEQPSGSRTIVEKLEKYSDVGYAFVILTPDDIGALDRDTMKKIDRIIKETISVAQNVWHMKAKPPHIGTSTRIAGDLSDGISRTTSEMNRISPEHIEKTRRKLRTLRSSFGYRARQNVVLEFGYFIGLLDRDRVCCLYKGVVLPSDMSGIVYIPFKESVNEVRDKIVKELKAAGYEIKI